MIRKILRRFGLHGWQLNLLLIAGFLSSIEFMGSVLIPFYHGWGQLNGAQMFQLQSVFWIAMFLAEVPTGIIGDRIGRKASMLMSGILHVIGIVVYTMVPDFRLFILGEILFGIGVAFNSGAAEAFMYEKAKVKDLTDQQYNDYYGVMNNLKMAGMLVASALSVPLMGMFDPVVLFKLSALASIAYVVLVAIVPDLKDGNLPDSETLVPDFKGTFVEAVKVFKQRPEYLRLGLHIGLVATAAYYVIWLHQELLAYLQVPEMYFGAFRAVLIVAEVVMMWLGIWGLKRSRAKIINLVSVFSIGASFILAGAFPSIHTLLLLVIFAGGIGLQYRNIFSAYLNAGLKNETRATVLSIVSMGRQMFIGFLNLFMGYLLDKSLAATLVLVGLIAMVGLLLAPSTHQLQNGANHTQSQ